jgi:hypothetical protein
MNLIYRLFAIVATCIDSNTDLRCFERWETNSWRITMHEMTPSEMLRDPLIRQMLRADKISLASFAALLDAAARQHARPANDSSFATSKMPDSWSVDAAAYI